MKDPRNQILEVIKAIEIDEGVANLSSPLNTYGLKTKYASIPHSTGEILRGLVIEKKPKHILEIGSSVGYSALWLALAALETGSKITCTEINSARLVLAKKNFHTAGVEDIIKLIESDAKLVLKDLLEKNQMLDFVFLDAFKKEYAEYIDQIYPILNQNGIIVIDNVISHQNILQKLLEKISKDLRFSTQKIEQDNGILILTKV